MNQAGHWTNDELLAALYGVGPEGGHLEACADCRSRFAAMRSRRESIELEASPSDLVTSSFLAAQRRAVYHQIDKPIRWWQTLSVRRWAAGVAAASVLGGTLFVYEQNHQMRLAQERINDARLMQEVADMAGDTDASSMAPLQGLFEQ